MGEVSQHRWESRIPALVVAATVFAATAIGVAVPVAGASGPPSAPPGQTSTPPGQAKKTAVAVAAVAAAQPPGQAKKATTATAAPTAPTSAPSTPTKTPAKSSGGGTHGRASHPLPPTSRAPAVSAVHAPAPAAPVASRRAVRAPAASRARRHVASRRHRARAHRPVVRAVAPPAVHVAAPVAAATDPAAAAPASVAHRRRHAPAPRRHDARPAARHADAGTPVVTPVFREIRDVVTVIPAGVWIAIAALAALSLLLAVFSARQARRARRQRLALREDLDVLQAAVLPAVPATLGALALTVAHRAATGPAAGGDFHDVVELSGGRVALVVGDVAGHGREAVAQAASVRFTLRAHLERGADPREALEIAAATLADRFGEDGFATVAVAVHDPVAGTLSYSTAAHDAPIVLGPGAHEPVLASAGTPLGAGGRPARRRTIVPFGAGSVACLLTDGAFEARTGGGGLVGREQLAAWLAELGDDASARDLVELVTERADVHDDIAVCLAHGRAGVDSGTWRVEELRLAGGDAARGEASRFLAACGVDGVTLDRALADVAAADGPVLLRVRLEPGRAPEVTARAERRIVAVAAA